VEGLTFAYADGTEALSDIHLHAQTGSTLAVIGPNGAGKTTLLKIILGLLGGYRGKVEVAGMDPVAARRKGGIVAWVPQRSRTAIDFPATVRQVVRMGLVGKTGVLRFHSRENLKYADDVMDALGIADLAARPIGQVSGGQAQRAIIARALASRPRLLLLDEPTVGVDEAGLETFSALTRQIRRDFNVTQVIVSHDLRTVVADCQTVACMNRRLHFHDVPSRLTPELIQEVFRCKLTGWLSALPEGEESRSEAPSGPAAHSHCDHAHGEHHE
jgi:zinc transport system ATP-binding protein